MLAPAPDWWSPTVKKKPGDPGYTQEQVDASLAANPLASHGGYEGVGPTYGSPAAAAAWAGTPGGNARGNVHVAGYDPDYAALIAGDPTLLAGTTDVEAYRQQVARARQDAIRRAVIQTGFTPGAVTGDLDKATLDAAAANQFSTAADLARTRSMGQTDLQASLAARGILDSGALQGGSDRVQQNYERGTTQGTQQLLDLISGVEGDSAAKNDQLNARISQLRQDAAARVANDPRYQPIGDTDAVFDPESGLYVTNDGRWYTADGTRTGTPASWGHGGTSAGNPSIPTAPAPPPAAPAVGPAPPQTAAALISQGVDPAIARRIAREQSYGLDV